MTKRIYVGVSSKEDFKNIMSIKESKSDVNCLLDNQCIVGRMHKGDENGETLYKYGRLSFMGKNILDEIFSKYTLVFSDVHTSNSQKESESDFSFSNSCVIVGRHHEGDENAQTYYRYREVWVKKKLESNDTRIPLSTEKTEEKSCKESDGIWMESEYSHGQNIEYLPMTGRKHTGDENGQTKYEFSLFYFEIDEDGNIIKPDNAPTEDN